MTNVALPITPDERIKLYDWVKHNDRFYTELGLNPPGKIRRVWLVTKILLINGAVRVELCYDPMRGNPTEYCWTSPDELNVVPL